MSNKDCYGNLDIVFPLLDRELREVPNACSDCPDKVACLRAALATPAGLEFQYERQQRSPVSGVTDFIRRWSQNKQLSRLREQKSNRFFSFARNAKSKKT